MNHPKTLEHRNQYMQMINPKKLYDARSHGYSHAVVVHHAQQSIHIAGQSGHNAQGELAEDFVDQLKQVLKNMMIVLDEVGATLLDIAILRVYVVDYNNQKHHDLIAMMHSLWGDSPFPACSLVPVPCLALSGMLIEIEATAFRL